MRRGNMVNPDVAMLPRTSELYLVQDNGFVIKRNQNKWKMRILSAAFPISMVAAVVTYFMLGFTGAYGVFMFLVLSLYSTAFLLHRTGNHVATDVAASLKNETVGSIIFDFEYSIEYGPELERWKYIREDFFRIIGKAEQINDEEVYFPFIDTLKMMIKESIVSDAAMYQIQNYLTGVIEVQIDDLLNKQRMNKNLTNTGFTDSITEWGTKGISVELSETANALMVFAAEKTAEEEEINRFNFGILQATELGKRDF